MHKLYYYWSMYMPHSFNLRLQNVCYKLIMLRNPYFVYHKLQWVLRAIPIPLFIGLLTACM